MFCFIIGELRRIQFRSRALKFPGLISGCTLDWFQPWPREALIAVAHHFLATFNLFETEHMRKEVEKALGSIQESVAETSKEYFQRSVGCSLFDWFFFWVRTPKRLNC